MNRHLKYVVFVIQHMKVILCSPLNIIQFFMSEFVVMVYYFWSLLFGSGMLLVLQGTLWERFN